MDMSPGQALHQAAWQALDLAGQLQRQQFGIEPTRRAAQPKSAARRSTRPRSRMMGAVSLMGRVYPPCASYLTGFRTAVLMGV